MADFRDPRWTVAAGVLMMIGSLLALGFGALSGASGVAKALVLTGAVLLGLVGAVLALRDWPTPVVRRGKGPRRH